MRTALRKNGLTKNTLPLELIHYCGISCSLKAYAPVESRTTARFPKYVTPAVSSTRKTKNKPLLFVFSKLLKR